MNAALSTRRTKTPARGSRKALFVGWLSTGVNSIFSERLALFIDNNIVQIGPDFICDISQIQHPAEVTGEKFLILFRRTQAGVTGAVWLRRFLLLITRDSAVRCESDSQRSRLANNPISFAIRSSSSPQGTPSTVAPYQWDYLLLLQDQRNCGEIECAAPYNERHAHRNHVCVLCASALESQSIRLEAADWTALFVEVGFGGKSFAVVPC